MNTRKIATVVTAVALTIGGLALAAPAVADDTTQEVTSSPDTAATTPSPTSPSDTPTEASAPSTPAAAQAIPQQASADDSAPPTAATPVETTPTTPPATDSAPSQSAVATPGPLTQTPFDGWDTWLISGDGSKKGPVGHVSVGSDDFPQTYLGSGQIAPTCGQYVQQDRYIGTVKQHDKLLAAGPLTWKGNHASDQDFGLQVADWTLVYGGDCAPPPPAAQSCTPSGDWYSEDHAPEQTADGLLFAGGSGSAVDWYHPASGNLQGLGDQSITFSQVHGYQPSFTVVFYRNTSGPSTGYANLVAEWYMNGGSASTDGTFAVTASTVWWTNKIASGPGSQSDPQPMSFFVNLWPNNQLISFGPHLGSTADADTSSVVTAISGCANEAFVPLKPEPKVTTETWTKQVCDVPADGTATVTVYGQDTTISPVWSDESHAYVDGEPVKGEVYTVSTHTVDDKDCAAVVVPPTPTPTPSAPVSTESLGSPLTPTSDVLAHTGSSIDISGVMTVAGILVLLGLLAGAANIVIRRQHRVTGARHSDK